MQQDPTFDDGVPLVETVASSPSRGKTWPEVLACLFACLGGLAAGFVLGYSSPTEYDLVHEPPHLLTEDQKSWFSSLITLGAIVGGPLAGWFVELTGRRGTIMFISVPYLAGWLLISNASHFSMLYAGRILTGVALGMTSLAVPLYIAEIASQSMRGALGASFQLSIVTGILGVYSLGIAIKWAWLAIASAVVPTSMAVAMLFMPETPRWLLKNGYRGKALVALTWLNGPSIQVDDEIEEIEANLEQQVPMSCRELGRCSILKPLFVSIGLMAFQQLSGINCVMFNAASIFLKAGFKDPSLPSLITAAVQVGATLLSVILMDRLGRRILLIIAGVVMTLSCVAFGLYDYLVTKPDPVTVNLNALALVSIIMYITGFSIGWGPVPWLVMSEIFPVRARGLASGISTAVNWTCSFMITNQFANLEQLLKVHGTFWLFAGVNFLGIVFVILALPETKGKSLEEIEQHFGSKITKVDRVIHHTEVQPDIQRTF